MTSDDVEMLLVSLANICVENIPSSLSYFCGDKNFINGQIAKRINKLYFTSTFYDRNNKI